MLSVLLVISENLRCEDPECQGAEADTWQHRR
jgi:hypothetical protein